MTRTIALALAAFAIAASAQATELRIRVPPPPGSGSLVQLKRARLLLAWWGDTQELALPLRYEGQDLMVTVPLDDDVWRKIDNRTQPPEFGYIYLEFREFVAVRSDRFQWGTVDFGFPGGERVTLSDRGTAELKLTVRRPVSRQLRFVDFRQCLLPVQRRFAASEQIQIGSIQ